MTGRTSGPITPAGAVVARNSLLNLVVHAGSLLIGVAALPFIVRRLGVEHFALLSLSWVILGSALLLDLGMGRATTKFAAEAMAKGTNEEVHRLAWNAILAQAVTGGVLGLLLAALTPWLVGRVQFSAALQSDAAAVFYLLALTIPFIQIGASFQGILEAGQRFDLANVVKLPANAATYLIPAVGAYFGYSVPQIVGMLMVSRILAAYFMFALTARALPGITKPRGFDYQLFSKLFRFGSWVTVSSLIVPVFVYLERFLIVFFVSLTALTYYAAPFEIITKILIVPVSVASALLPAFSARSVVDRGSLAEMFSRPMKFLLAVMIPAGAALLAFREHILQLWFGAEIARQSEAVFPVLVVICLLNGFAYIPYTAVQGLGRPDLKAKLDLLELPLYIALCAALIPSWGITGAAAAKLGVSIVDFVALFFLAARISGLRFREMFAARCTRTLVVSAGFGGALLLAVLPWPTLFSRLLIFSAFGALYLLGLAKCALDRADWETFHAIRKQVVR